MKPVILLILMFSIFSCNNSAEYVDAISDSTQVVSPDTALSETVVITPAVQSNKEKLEQSLASFEHPKIDSIDTEDILEVIKDILETLNEEAEKDDWKNVAEYYEKTESTMKQTAKGTDIFNKNQSEFDKMKNKIENHRLEELEAEKHLKQISSKSRWEKIRNSFQKKLDGGELTEFSNEQHNAFNQILADWDAYKQNNKLSWYRNGETNLEDLFFNYSKNNAKAKAAWGFIIQQVDWNGAVNYFTNVAPDAKATGQPYYMLKYYYNTIDKGTEHKALYDDATDATVTKLCPPVH